MSSGHPSSNRDGRRAAAETRHAARELAATLRGRRLPTDEAFDRFLPAELRDVSPRYWTPLRAVRQAGRWLREVQARTVVDIGSGAGKFCVAAALITPCRFVGVEQRASLAAAARDLATTFEVAERVSFVHGDVASTAVPAADAYYLFNPFGEYAFYSQRFSEPDIAFTRQSFDAGLATVVALLSRASPGTFVITLNGIGGPLPSGYEQIDVAWRMPGTLRLWKKSAGAGVPG